MAGPHKDLGVETAKNIGMLPANDRTTVDLLKERYGIMNLQLYIIQWNLEDFVAHVEFIRKGGRRVVVHAGD
jgi:hypothetical protein